MFNIAFRVQGPLLTDPTLVRRISREIYGALLEIGALGQRLLVERTPHGASSGGGGLRGSAFYEARGTEAAPRGVRIALSAFYAPIVEEGRSSGKRPPLAPILLWVTRKLSIGAGAAPRVAFLVARKIGRHGYKGYHMVERTYQQLLGIIPARAALLEVRLARLMRGA